MSHLTDARDILFADPQDIPSDVSELSIDDHIEVAEWQVEVAIANLNACVNDADRDRAAFDLKCAVSHVNDLCEKREACDREIQRQGTENCASELGCLATESDQQDNAIAEGAFSHG
jgi:hypothetical protein